MNDPVFVKNEIAASALARVEGFVNDTIALELLFETQPGKKPPATARSIKSVRQRYRPGDRICNSSPMGDKLALA